MTGRGKLARIILTAALPALAVVLAVPTPAAAQSGFSEGYKFLDAVKKKDGAKVEEALLDPSSQIINSRDVTTGETALHIVVKRSDATYVRFLASRGANVNAQDGRGNTPLMLAVSGNCGECVATLIQRKANLNLANASGETPLIRAVQMRNLELARELLTAGANPDQADRVAGLSARDYARQDTRSPALTKLLTEAPKTGARAVSGPSL